MGLSIDNGAKELPVITDMLVWIILLSLALEEVSLSSRWGSSWETVRDMMWVWRISRSEALNPTFRGDDGEGRNANEDKS